MWYVYILKCSDDTLYTGITTDVDARVDTHNSKKGAKYTRGRVPARLIYSESHPTKSEALKREIEIQSWPKKRKEMFIKK